MLISNTSQDNQKDILIIKPTQLMTKENNL
jgi:hypothetical protein